MSILAIETACSCQTIGTPQKIRFCEPHHRYWFGDRQLASFHSVLNAIYPQKQAELGKIDPVTLEHARERGLRVDRYCSEYAPSGNVRIDPGEWQEVVERVRIFVNWFEIRKPGVRGVQQIVYSLDDGVATTKDFDFTWDDKAVICDLKCTYSLDWTWKAQLGCHARYSVCGTDGLYYFLYILHINPKLYAKSGGFRLLPYDRTECLRIWDAAVAWWRELPKKE